MAAASSSIATLAANKTTPPAADSEVINTVIISKQTALGITICGGTNKPEGPYVYIERVIPGLDVANVS